MLPQIFDVRDLAILIFAFVFSPHVSQWIIDALEHDKDDVALQLMQCYNKCDANIFKVCCRRQKTTLLLHAYTRNQLGVWVQGCETLQQLMLRCEHCDEILLHLQEFLSPTQLRIQNSISFKDNIVPMWQFKKYCTEAIVMQDDSALLNMLKYAQNLSYDEKIQSIVEIIEIEPFIAWRTPMIECLCTLPYAWPKMIFALHKAHTANASLLIDPNTLSVLYKIGILDHANDTRNFFQVRDVTSAAMFYDKTTCNLSQVSVAKINAVARAHSLSSCLAWNIFSNPNIAISKLNDSFFKHLNVDPITDAQDRYNFVLYCINRNCPSGLKWATQHFCLTNQEANDLLLKMTTKFDACLFVDCIQAWDVSLREDVVEYLTTIALEQVCYLLWSKLVQTKHLNIATWSKPLWLQFNKIDDIRFAESVCDTFDNKRVKFLFFDALENRYKTQVQFWATRCDVLPNLTTRYVPALFECEMWDILVSVAKTNDISQKSIDECYKVAATKNVPTESLEFLERVWPLDPSMLTQSFLVKLLSGNFKFICFLYRMRRISGDTLVRLICANKCNNPRSIACILDELKFDIDVQEESLDIVETIYSQIA